MSVIHLERMAPERDAMSDGARSCKMPDEEAVQVTCCGRSGHEFFTHVALHSQRKVAGASSFGRLLKACTSRFERRLRVHKLILHTRSSR